MSKPAAVITTLEDSPPWLDQRLLSAYLQTTYQVVHGPSIRVGRYDTAVDCWLAQAGSSCYAILTAWNPFSRMLASTENDARNEALAADLADWAVRLLPAWGMGDSGDWPAEASFCALEISPEKAVLLGQEYGQHALVYGRLGHASELWWLPEMPS